MILEIGEKRMVFLSRAYLLEADADPWELCRVLADYFEDNRKAFVKVIGAVAGSDAETRLELRPLPNEYRKRIANAHFVLLEPMKLLVCGNGLILESCN